MTILPYIFILFTFFYSCLPAALQPRFGPPSSISIRSGSTSPRKVTIGLLLNFETKEALTAQTPKEFHSFLEVQGDGGANGNFRIEIRNIDNYPLRAYTAVRILDFGEVSRSPPAAKVGPASYTKVFAVPEQITLSNEELLSSKTGKGIVSEVWAQDTTYRLGENNCNHFVQKLSTKLGLTLPEGLKKGFADAEAFYRAAPFTFPATEVPVRYERSVGVGKPADVLGEWTVENPNNPTSIRDPPPSLQRSSAGNIPDLFVDDSPKGLGLDPLSEADMRSATLYEYPFGVDESKITPLNPQPCGRKRDCITESKGQKVVSTNLAVTRTGGSLAMYASFGLEVLKGAGVAALVAAPVFILLDLVKGEFTAAAFGAAGLVGGLVAGFAVGGPLGFFVGAVVAALFAILPGLFKAKTPPPSNNPAQIIQWSFFGDKGHTGNEQCNKNRTAAGLPANCTAAYGPGVLSKVFGWSVFDATAFLVNYNGGHSMSIIDIAAAFQVKDYTVTDWGSNVTAVIDCGRVDSNNVKRDGNLSPWLPDGLGGVWYPESDPETQLTKRQVPVGSPLGYKSPSGKPASPSQGYECSKPKYSLKRSLINIPYINKTADAIFNQTIPAPGGTCKIISQPINGQHYDLFDITITGLPVSFICNLTTESFQNETLSASDNYNDTAPSNTTGKVTSSRTLAIFVNSTDLLSNSTGTNGTNTSSTAYVPSGSPAASLTPGQSTTGAISSSGTRGGYEPALPPQPFAPLTAQNSTCIGSQGQTLCLPNGTFSPQKGSLGFTTNMATSLSILPLHEISWELPVGLTDSGYGGGNPFAHSIGDEKYTVPYSYFTNVTDKTDTNNAFKQNMTLITTSNIPFNITGTSPPCVCLYTNTSYQGNVACFGVGGGNLTGTIGSKAKSLSLRARATVWLYADHYNDLGGTYLSTASPDLTNEAYGTSGNFSERIKAMWVKAPA